MMNRGAWSAAATLAFVWGCAGAPEVTEPEAGSQQERINAAGSVLGFETAATWHGLGTIASSPVHSEGTASLAVQPAGYRRYVSDAFELTGQLRNVALDIQLPTLQPNPSWLG